MEAVIPARPTSHHLHALSYWLASLTGSLIGRCTARYRIGSLYAFEGSSGARRHGEELETRAWSRAWWGGTSNLRSSLMVKEIGRR